MTYNTTSKQCSLYKGKGTFNISTEDNYGWIKEGFSFNLKGWKNKVIFALFIFIIIVILLFLYRKLRG